MLFGHQIPPILSILMQLGFLGGMFLAGWLAASGHWKRKILNDTERTIKEVHEWNTWRNVNAAKQPHR